MLYFDTSFIVPYILPEATSSRIQQFFREHDGEELTISHWTRVEFASMLAREVRLGALPRQAARDADLRFETAMAQSFTVVLLDRSDFDLCKRYLQRFETALRVGDALHLAIANNRDAQMFYTLDRKLLRAGKLLGLPIATGIRGRE